MRPVNDYSDDEARDTNMENTVGVIPVKNAAGQKPAAVVRADYLAYAAKVAKTEYGTPVETPNVYVWVMDDRINCNWLALSHTQRGQYPDEAVVIAGRIDRGHEIVP